MRRAECVVHVAVGQRGQRLRELRIVLFLLRVKAQVLEQDDAPGGNLLNQPLNLRPRAIVHEGDGAPEQVRQVAGHGPEAELGVDRSFGPSQMTGQNDGGAMIEREPYRRQRGANARVVADDAVFERHVEVDPDEEPLALKIEIANRQLGHGRRNQSPRFTNARSRSTQRLE